MIGDYLGLDWFRLRWQKYARQAGILISIVVPLMISDAVVGSDPAQASMHFLGQFFDEATEIVLVTETGAAPLADGSSRDRDYGWTEIVREFNVLNDQEKRGVVNVTVFLIGLYVLFAYLYIRGGDKE